jgi:hypothetical protein
LITIDAYTGINELAHRPKPVTINWLWNVRENNGSKVVVAPIA